jgi:hypothetical protein
MLLFELLNALRKADRESVDVPELAQLSDNVYRLMKEFGAIYPLDHVGLIFLDPDDFASNDDQAAAWVEANRGLTIQVTPWIDMCLRHLRNEANTAVGNAYVAHDAAKDHGRAHLLHAALHLVQCVQSPHTGERLIEKWENKIAAPLRYAANSLGINKAFSFHPAHKENRADEMYNRIAARNNSLFNEIEQAMLEQYNEGYTSRTMSRITDAAWGMVRTTAGVPGHAQAWINLARRLPNDGGISSMIIDYVQKFAAKR